MFREPCSSFKLLPNPRTAMATLEMDELHNPSNYPRIPEQAWPQKGKKNFQRGLQQFQITPESPNRPDHKRGRIIFGRFVTVSNYSRIPEQQWQHWSWIRKAFNSFKFPPNPRTGLTSKVEEQFSERYATVSNYSRIPEQAWPPEGKKNVQRAL